MQIELSPELDNDLRKLKRKDSRLSKQIEKQLALFIENPKHPSLRVHKLTGELKNLWSISINKSIRMVYIFDADQAYFVKIGTHDQVYK